MPKAGIPRIWRRFGRRQPPKMRPCHCEHSRTFGRTAGSKGPAVLL